MLLPIQGILKNTGARGNVMPFCFRVPVLRVAFSGVSKTRLIYPIIFNTFNIIQPILHLQLEDQVELSYIAKIWRTTQHID